MPQREQRCEPTLNPDVRMLLDVVDPSGFTLAVPSRQSRKRTSYRLIDWLMGIAFVMISLAFALDRSLIVNMGYRYGYGDPAWPTPLLH
jgi:hypothetical protein